MSHSRKTDSLPVPEYDSESGFYRARFRRDEFEDVCTAVVSAVAHVQQTDPLKMRPLYESIDPDALDRLFSPRPDGTLRTGGSVTFQFGDCTVTVTGNRAIHIRPSDDRPSH